MALTKPEGGGQSEINETVIRQAVPDPFNMAIRRTECCLSQWTRNTEHAAAWFTFLIPGHTTTRVSGLYLSFPFTMTPKSLHFNSSTPLAVHRLLSDLFT